jgi:hypothetical protein
MDDDFRGKSQKRIAEVLGCNIGGRVKGRGERCLPESFTFPSPVPR